jgi:hypothetical protein
VRLYAVKQVSQQVNNIDHHLEQLGDDCLYLLIINSGSREAQAA